MKRLICGAGLARRAVFHANTGGLNNFTTTLTNQGTTLSAPLVVAMNIVNPGSGAPVDPEDWAPERAQHVDPLRPGRTVQLSWKVFSILEGDYMVYMVALEEPSGPDATTHPVTGPQIHLTVQRVPRYNPGGVLPLTLGVPIAGGAVWSALLWWRRRGLDAGS